MSFLHNIDFPHFFDHKTPDAQQAMHHNGHLPGRPLFDHTKKNQAPLIDRIIYRNNHESDHAAGYEPRRHISGGYY